MIKWIKNRFRKSPDWITEEDRLAVITKSSKQVSRGVFFSFKIQSLKIDSLYFYIIMGLFYKILSSGNEYDLSRALSVL
jgi:hypothetical protein